MHQGFCKRLCWRAIASGDLLNPWLHGSSALIVQRNTLSEIIEWQRDHFCRRSSGTAKSYTQPSSFCAQPPRHGTGQTTSSRFLPIAMLTLSASHTRRRTEHCKPVVMKISCKLWGEFLWGMKSSSVWSYKSLRIARAKSNREEHGQCHLPYLTYHAVQLLLRAEEALYAFTTRSHAIATTARVKSTFTDFAFRLESYNLLQLSLRRSRIFTLKNLYTSHREQ